MKICVPTFSDWFPSHCVYKTNLSVLTWQAYMYQVMNAVQCVQTPYNCRIFILACARLDLDGGISNWYRQYFVEFRPGF